MIRCFDGFTYADKDVHGDSFEQQKGCLALFLVSPENKARLHLRLKAAWILQAETGRLVDACLKAKTNEDILNLLTGAEHFD